MTFRLFLLALCLSSTVWGTAQAEGDAARGKVLGYTCHGCHGIQNYKNAYPTYSVPKLGGQNAKYMTDALKGYATGDRVHSTMTAHAASLTDAQRADIAAFFAATPARSAGEPVGTAPAAAAICVSCHGSDGLGISAEYPILAGQHQDYLEHSLRDYKSGKRKNAVMAGIIAGVKDADIPVLARYFAQQKPALCATDKIRDKGKCQ
ncbi:MAG: c-type cytochrome [Candidatus Obscuribacterales bacterium]|nr:c-type cytochrome [Steroidobacteraceae bacterium]